MTCCHSLTCCAHSDCISAPALCESYLCRCLIVRSCKLNVNTFLNLNATLRCTLADHILKTLAIHFAHIRESCSKFINIRSDQWAWNSCCNMICDHHEISGFIRWIASTCRICKKNLLRPKHSHQTCRKNNIRHLISLIIMNTSLHDHNRCILYITKYKASFMSLYCRNRKSFNLCIIDGLLNLDPICEVSKSGSENQRHFWFKIDLLSYTFKTCN